MILDNEKSFEEIPEVYGGFALKKSFMEIGNAVLQKYGIKAEYDESANEIHIPFVDKERFTLEELREMWPDDEDDPKDWRVRLTAVIILSKNPSEGVTEAGCEYYYQMCDELLAEVEACPELLAKDSEREVNWKDNSHHILVTDLIYCFGVYKFMRDGLYEPVPRKKGKSTDSSQAERAQKASELQERLEKLQDEMDAIEKEIADLPQYSFEGKTMKTKLYGDVIISKQDGEYLTFSAAGKDRQFALPGCITNGFLIPDDAAITERYKTESSLQEKLQKLSTEQRMLNIELAKY